MIHQNELIKLIDFLNKVDKLFPVPISDKTDIKSYAEKLLTNADFASCEEDGRILGLVAGYIGNSIDDNAYISTVAVCSEIKGKGIGKRLVSEFIARATENGKKAVHLYAVKTNKNAMRMYESLGFEEWYIENEPRQDDVHLIYRIERN